MAKTIANIDDLRILAKKRVPKMFFDYIDRGSFSENTIKRNSEDFLKYTLAQKVLVDISKRTTKAQFIGSEYNLPVGIAPVGMSGFNHGAGEILAALAAEEVGAPFILSTMSICSVEQVAAVTNKPFWFQLYMMKDKSFMQDLIQRVKQAGCSVLVLTVDLQVLGVRYQDIRNGLSVPPKLTIANAINILSKPRWCYNMLKSPSYSFGNIAKYMEENKNKTDIKSLSAWNHDQFDTSLTWKDIKWIQDIWQGSIILKGVLSELDAKNSLESEVNGIIVSNHGGRQLDSASSSIAMLRPIAKVINKKIPVYFDGGIKSGTDILKALALGADGTFIGKSFAYGLGAMGANGVKKVFDILQQELLVSMALTGVNKIDEINDSIISEQK